ncbi:MAG: hypothetical protein BMS9Abin11_1655 [Gammaproteobacteria bacterium]|nr:MAG: hypothetical protein BMS9Abin11_1655 [Gammaproteobacteria bacterium]
MSRSLLSRLFGAFIIIGDQTKSSDSTNEVVTSRDKGKTISAATAIGSNAFMAALSL